MKNGENNGVLAGVLFLSPSRPKILPSPSPFNSCHAGYSQSEVIVDAKVSDQQRRLVEISSVVIKVVLLAMCSLGFALLLSC